MWTQDNARVTLGVIYYDSKRVLLKNYQYYQKICLQGFPLFWSINAILFGWVGAKMAYLSVFFKYLQNYLLNWLEIFRVWFSDYLKVVLNNLLKIGVRKALKHTLSWMTSNQKNFLKIFFVFFSIIFHFLSFHVVFTSKNHLFWKKALEELSTTPFFEWRHIEKNSFFFCLLVCFFQ